MLKTRKQQLFAGTVLIAALAVVIIVASFVMKDKPEATYVSVGTVLPAEAIELSFEKAGRVVAINKKNGDEVAAGDLIAEQDHTTAQYNLTKAKATLQADELAVVDVTKKLNTILSHASTTPTATSSSEFVAVLQKTYSIIEDAIYTKTDQIFLNPRAEKPQIIFPTDNASKLTIESGRIEVGERLASLSIIMANVSSTTNPDTISDSLKKDSAEVKLYLDNVGSVISGLSPNIALSSSTVATWKADLVNARKRVDESLAVLIAAEQIYKDPASATTSPVYKMIQGLRADVAKAIAKRNFDEQTVGTMSIALGKTYIYAPVSGIVASTSITENQYVTAHQTVASITTSALYQLNIPIPDAVVGKLSIGSAAEISIEGIDKTFRSVLVALNPVVIQGTKSYRATIQFLEVDKRLKPGAFATVTMHLK